jgi:TRAP-type mannitol/chloroaromatic compound transport system substrate-binding protein
MISEFMARNATSLAEIARDDSVQILKFPDSVLTGLKALTLEVVEELAAEDEIVARVWASYRAFMENSRSWQEISEQAYLATRAL